MHFLLMSCFLAIKTYIYFAIDISKVDKENNLFGHHATYLFGIFHKLFYNPNSGNVGTFFFFYKIKTKII